MIWDLLFKITKFKFLLIRKKIKLTNFKLFMKFKTSTYFEITMLKKVKIGEKTEISHFVE